MLGDTAASFVFDCSDGVPSAVTSVSIYDDSQPSTSTAESALTGSASVESASTTLTASAGPGQANPNLLTLSVVTAFAANRRYWLTSIYGWRELVETVGKDTTNKYLYLRTLLQSDYQSGDTIASPRISQGFDSTWIADTSNLSGARYSSSHDWLTAVQRDYLAQLDPNPRWRAEVVCTVASATKHYTAFFDVIRNTLSHGVTAQDVDRLSRGWLYRLAAEDQGEADAVIAEAFHQVKFDLHAYDIAAYALSGRDTLAEAVRRKAVALVHQQAYHHGGGDVSATLMEDSAKFYADLLEKLLGAKARATAQLTSDGAAGLPNNAPLWVR